MEGESGVGYIMPDGTFVSLDEPEGMFVAARTLTRSPAELAELMAGFGRECAAKGSCTAAEEYLKKAVELSSSPRLTAFCLLALGQIREKHEDYPGAVGWYRKAFLMKPERNDTWYLLYNNVGYCMSRIGRHREAEALCRKAIEIDLARHNAHKNLGIALEGLGRYGEAADSYLMAAISCPADPRALARLEALLAGHPEVEREVPDLRGRMVTCRRHAGMVWH